MCNNLIGIVEFEICAIIGQEYQKAKSSFKQIQFRRT